MKPPDSFKALAPDALAALEGTGMSRRTFMKRSGVLIVGFSMAGLPAGLGMVPSRASAQGFNGPGSDQLDSWIAIGAAGSVTAYTGKCELGHGLYTAQTQLIAEELGVGFDRVTLIQCDTALTPDQGTTSGAQSHPTNFNQRNLALAGATAREALLERASTRLGVSADQLDVNDGTISVRADPSRRVRYGELVGGGTFAITLNAGARRKHPSDWTVLGQSVPRVEIPAMATGQFEYVHNVRVPGMLHGRVVRPPRVGSTLVRVDEGSVQDMPGLVEVVVKNDFVGVVAEKPWQAVQAANQLRVTWTEGAGLPKQQDFYEHLRGQKPTRDTSYVNSKDVDEQLAGAATLVEAHLPLSVSNARFARQLLCGSRCPGRQSHDLVGDAGSLPSQKDRRHGSRATTGKRPRHLQNGCRMLWRQWCGHCFFRRGALVCGGGRPGSCPAHAKG